MAVKSLYVEPEVDSGEVRWGALEFKDVFRIYRSGPVETVALRGLDLHVQPGEIVAIWGPSGCGKSTFLSLAGGLDQPSAGEIRVFGRSLARMDEADLARYRARQVAIVFQSDNVWPSLSTLGNVVVSLRMAGVPEARARAIEALRSFGLGDRLGQAAVALSGGERQRLAIAAAAARRSPLVLADEPTGELDRANEQLVLEAFATLRSEVDSTVVLVTHSEAVASAADRVIEMRDGRALT